MQLVPKTVVPASNPTPTTKKITLDVGSMKCGGCVKTVEKLLLQHPGTIAVSVNLVTEVAVVECQVDTEPQELATQLTLAGYPTKLRYAQSQPLSGETTTPALEDAHQKQRQEMRLALGQLITSALLLILSSLGHLPESWLALPLLKNIWLHWGLATITLLVPGRPIIVDGWRGLQRNAPNMNTLVALGTLTAYGASAIALLFPQLGWECFFDEPVMLLGFILLGRTLEQQARGRAAAAFKRLLALQPQVARLIAQPQGEFTTSDRSSVEIPADRVRVGEWLQVLPGEKIPVDGEVVAGQTTVDESMLTGEALPTIKQPGDIVTAGTLNKSGAIALRATRTGSDTTLAQIVALVEAAQTRKAPVQKLADTVAGYFTYGVLAAALLTFLFWYFIGTHIWSDVLVVGHAAMGEHAALHTQHLANAQILKPSPLLLSLKLAISVMVVACPCAMGLATPTAILVGTGVGAETGLLIKGGDVLERVHQIDTVVFDKTGTLTSGHPTVTDWLVVDGVLPAAHPHILQLAAAVESGTSHPLAAAIVQAAQQQNLPILAAKDFYTEPGLGVSAVLEDGLKVLVGNAQWLSQQAIEIPDAQTLQAQIWAAAGKTVVFVAAGDRFIGLIAASDTLRADACQVVERLRAGLGLKVMLLTGDKLAVAKDIASQVGISDDDIIADIRPAGKAAAIEQLQAQHHRVAMVGDGINDAPALSQADVGIALKAGTDVAMEAAQIVLMRDRLTDVVSAIELSRATFNKIRQNLFWAFAYNTLGIPIAAGVLLPSLDFALSPAAAGALMAFSSVSVVTNSLLLRRFK